MRLASLAVSLGCLLLSATCLAQQSRHRIYTFDGDSTGDRFGTSVSDAGDVNKDGIPDFIVGAPYDDNIGLPNGGSARVISGKDGRFLYTLNDSGPDMLGVSVGGAGDVDKDGYADLIAGAPNAGDGYGRARVFSGKTGRQIYAFNGYQITSRLGQSVSGAGDVNRDGFADVVVGAPGDNSKNSGSAHVYSGKDGKIIYTFNGDSAWDRFGWSVSGAGDVNKDGFADIIVGARQGPGYARVYSGKDGKALYTFNSAGESVSDAGDVNKDGFADVIVGAPSTARVYSGKDGKIIYTFNSAGRSVSGAGDVNKDGFVDLIVGAPGSAQVYSGKDGRILYTFRGDSAGDWFGSSVSGAGDLNGDGYADLIVGAPRDYKNGTDAGSVSVLSGQALTLTTDHHAFYLSGFSTQTLHLDAGTAHNGRLYWLFGSATGTSPGLTLASAIGRITIPLNPDPWTDITVALANSPMLVNTRGRLDAKGHAKAQIKGGPVQSASAIGLVLYHAYLVYDAQGNFYMASNPATLLLAK